MKIDVFNDEIRPNMKNFLQNGRRQQMQQHKQQHIPIDGMVASSLN